MQLNPRPQQRVAAPARASQPKLASSQPAKVQQSQARVRMQNDAPAPRTTLRMPSPEELGIRPAAARSDEVDWLQVRKRIQSLSLTSFHMQKLPEGGFRFVCFVPTQSGDRRIEAESLTEAEAIDRALAQAESLR